MNQPRWAKRLAEAAAMLVLQVQEAKADGIVDREESQMLEAKAQDLRILSNIVNAGDDLAQASQRAGDPEYLAGKLAHFEAWVALAPLPAA